MLPPEVVDICQPCELIVEPLTVGAVDLMNHQNTMPLVLKLQLS
jgi:hypothetical protein